VVRHTPQLRGWSRPSADLAAGDIPLFVTRPDARDLWDASKRIADFLGKPGWTGRRRLREWVRRTWPTAWLSASLATLPAAEARLVWLVG
jgi:hypothetical protein